MTAYVGSIGDVIKRSTKTKRPSASASATAVATEGEQLDPAIKGVRRLLLHADHRVAVAHPRAAAACKTELAELAEHLIWRPYFSIGGATNSPSPTMMTASRKPAMPSHQQNRTVVTPDARITMSSLPRARLPSPSRAMR